PTAPAISAASARWLSETAAAAEALHDETRESLKKARAGLSGFARALRDAAPGGRAALAARREEIDAAAGLQRSNMPKDLSVDRLLAFDAVLDAAKNLRNLADEETIFAAVDLLRPFALRARARLRREGKVTYAGLLALARDLLRDHPEVRRRLNARFRAILLDEAQDVDPIQLELILFLAERPGASSASPESVRRAGAKSWRDVELEAGKLFVVGDPKQSIYLFRGADVRAFRSVLELMGKQGAETLTPTTSMRSAQTVLDAVNAVGTVVFTPYPALAERPGRAAPLTGAAAEVLTVEPEDGEDAQAVEAAAVAARVKALIAGGLEPAEIAVLFRKRGPMAVFAAALRAVGLEASIEQERRF
ncbi:MAG: UvrD-helicase domain-containing protein, partial [bacterium]